MSTSTPSKAPARRRHPRMPAHVTVRWHNRTEEGVAAVVYDISAEGMFLVPEGRMPDSVSTGDTVWVVVSTSGREETLSGTVRWRGYHPAHNILGCGIHVEGPSVERMQRVFSIAPDP